MKNTSGEGGIRTRGTLAGTHDFQSCTFGHSVTSPKLTRHSVTSPEPYSPIEPLRSLAHLFLATEPHSIPRRGWHGKQSAPTTLIHRRTTVFCLPTGTRE